MFLGLLRSLRTHQWVKNTFALAPLVFAGKLTESAALLAALAAALFFCLASSAVYLFNDVRDKEQDRLHPLKRHRPIAAGVLPLPVAIAASLALAAVALGGAYWLSFATLTWTATYLVLNLLYSLWLKNVVILDVMIISLGFVLRVLAGGAAIDVQVSAWLLLCTILVALFLAFSKRRHELLLMSEGAAEQRRVLTHYSPLFLDQMINVVTASTVVSYAVYVVAPDTVDRFHTDKLIYTMPMVLFGIFRYLYLIYQRPTKRNPTEAILSDLPFLLNIFLWALAVLWIVYRG